MYNSGHSAFGILIVSILIAFDLSTSIIYSQIEGKQGTEKFIRFYLQNLVFKFICLLIISEENFYEERNDDSRQSRLFPWRSSLILSAKEWFMRAVDTLVIDILRWGRRPTHID